MGGPYTHGGSLHMGGLPTHGGPLHMGGLPTHGVPLHMGVFPHMGGTYTWGSSHTWGALTHMGSLPIHGGPYTDGKGSYERWLITTGQCVLLPDITPTSHKSNTYRTAHKLWIHHGWFPFLRFVATDLVEHEEKMVLVG